MVCTVHFSSTALLSTADSAITHCPIAGLRISLTTWLGGFFISIQLHRIETKPCKLESSWAPKGPPKELEIGRIEWDEWLNEVGPTAIGRVQRNCLLVLNASIARRPSHLRKGRITYHRRPRLCDKVPKKSVHGPGLPTSLVALGG